jgi:hypothetical protein
MSTTERLRDLTHDDIREVIIRVLDGQRPSAAQEFEGLTDDGILRVIKAAAAAIARLQAIPVDGVAALDKRRRDPDSVQDDLGFALRLTEADANDMVMTARSLNNRLPRTRMLMDAGELDFARATKVAKATAWLSDSAAGTADAALMKRLKGKDIEQVRDAARNAAKNADPVGAIRRTAQRRFDRKLTLTRHNAATAKLAINGAPADRAAAAYTRIDQAAAKLKTDGEPRTLDQLRADLTLDLLLGLNESEVLPAAETAVPTGTEEHSTEEPLGTGSSTGLAPDPAGDDRPGTMGHASHRRERSRSRQVPQRRRKKKGRTHRRS